MNIFRQSKRFVFSALALTGAISTAHANTATWNSTTGTSWNTAANWTGATGGTAMKPTSADNVVFDNSNVTIPTTIGLDGGQTVNSIQIGSSTGVALGAFTLEAFDTANTAETATLTSGAITLDASVTGMGTIGGNSSTNGVLTIATVTGGSYTITNNNTTQTLNIAAILKAVGTNNTTLDSKGGLIILGGANLVTGAATVGSIDVGTAVQLGSASAVTHFSSTTIDSGSSLDFNGQVEGAGVFTINGAGISGSSVYKGALINSTGAATDSGAITLGSSSTVYDSGTSLGLTGAINLAGFTLTLDGSGATTLSTGVISSSTGSGALTKNGTGTLTLSGANTFTGGVTLNAGEIIATNAGAFGKTSGQLTFGGASTTVDLKAVSTTFTTGINTATNGGTILVEPATSGGGVGDTLSLGNTLGSQTVVVGPGGNVASGNISLTLSGLTSFSGTTPNATFTINGDSFGNSSLLFTGGFANGGNTNTLTLNSGSGTGVNSATVSGAFTGTTGTLVLKGSAPVTVTLGAATGSDNNAVAVSGSGTYTFTGVNSFAGGLTLNSGLAISTTAATSLGNGLLTMNGGTLDLQPSSTTYGITGVNVTAASTIISDRSASAGGATYGLGPLSIGAQTLNISGGANVSSGTATIAFGATTFSAAPTFNITDPVAAGSVTAMTVTSLVNGGFTATLTGSGNFGATGVISGSGGLTMGVSGGTAYTGSVSLSGTNTYSGTTTINGGDLKFTTTGTYTPIGTGTLVINGGELDTSVAVLDGNANAVKVNGSFIWGGTSSLNLGFGGGVTTVTGSDAITENSSGLLTLGAVTLATTGGQTLTIQGGAQTGSTGANLTTGTVTISGNTVFNVINPTGSTGTTVVTIGSATTDGALGSIIDAGSGSSFTKSGTGNLYLTGTNNGLTGGVTVNAGILYFQGSDTGTTTSLGSGTITLNGGALGRNDGGGTRSILTNAINVTAGDSVAFVNGTSENLSGAINLGNGSTTRSIGAGQSNFSGTITLGSSSDGSGNVNLSTTGATPVTGNPLSFAGLIVDNSNNDGITINGTNAATFVLISDGANTYSGGVTLTSGFLQLDGASVVTGGTLISGGAGTGTITLNGGDLSFGHAITLANAVAIGASDMVGFGGTGTTGGTSVQAGTLSGATSIGSGATVTTVTPSGTFTETTAFTNTVTLGGNIALQPVGSTTLAFTNVIAGSGDGITIGSGSSTGVVSLSGANTYTGATTINSGVVNYSNGTAFGTNSAITVNSGATADIIAGITGGSKTLTISGSGAGTVTYGNSSTTYYGALQSDSNSSYAGNVILGANASIAANFGTLTLTGGINNEGFLLTINGSNNVIVNTTGISGTGGVTVTDFSTASFPTELVLNAASSYGGATTIQGGSELINGVANATPAGTTVTLGNSADVSTGTNTFDVGGFNQTIAGLTTGSGATSTQLVTNNGSSTATLTVNNTTSDTYSGEMQDGSSAFAFTKTGSGTFTVSGTSNTYTGATTVGAGNLQLTGSLGSGSAVTVGNNTATVAILSGTGTLSGSLATSTTGTNIAYIAPGVNTSGTRGDFGSVGTLHVGTLGFTIGAGTQFDYDINTATTAGGTSNDLIAMGGSGVLTIGGSGIVFNFDQLSALSTTGSYTLISGAGSVSGFSAADFSATGIGTDTATFTSSGGNLYVSFGTGGPTFTTGTYTLTSTVGATLLHVGATTTATTTLTNTGTGSADSLNYTGLGSTGGTGTVTGTAGAGGPVANAGGTAVATQTYTALTAGTDTVTPTGTVTGANSTPPPVDTGTATATIQVYSGTGSWTGTAGGVWGTAESSAPANWTAIGGIPGITPGFLTTDSASFGNSSTTQTITLSGASPYLNNITFNNTLAGSYTIAQGGTGTIHLENSGTSTATLVDSAGSNTISAPVELDSAASTTVATSDTLTISGNVSQGVSAEAMTIGGAGTTVLSGSNTYTGGTTVNGTATLLVSNTTAGGSATGTGALTVSPNGTIGGYGTSSGTSFNVAGSGTTTGTRANILVGLNSASDTNTSHVLTLVGSSTSTITNANLTFNLSTSTHGALGSDPSGSGTELSIGNTKLTFGGSTGSVLFSLNMQNEPGIVTAYTPYVLIAGTLPTGGGGVDGSQYTGLTLGNVLVSTGTVTETIIDSNGTNNLAVAFGNSTDQSYYGANSYLVLYQNTATGADDIDVVVVPEPGTWALMLGGLAFLVFWQRRKSSK